MATNRPRTERPAATAVIILLAMIAPLSTDMFLPSMPAMAKQLHTSTGSISLAVTLFILAFAASQLVWGPASDRFGRRPILVAGLSLYTLGAGSILAFPTFGTIVGGRVVQGIGGGAGFALASAIIIDVYRGDRALRVLALIASVTGIAPMIAPTIGGLLESAFGWKSVFVVFVAFGSVLLAGYLVVVPETLERKDPGALQFRQLLHNSTRLFRSVAYRSNVALMALLFSGQFVFISASSFVLIDQLGLSPRVFGLGFGFVAVGLVVGANATRRFGTGWDARQAIRTATVVGSTAAVTMAVVATAGARGAVWIILPMFIFAVCNGAIRPIAQASALVPFPMMAGLASAVMGFTQLATSSLVSVAFNGLLTPTSVSMTIAIAVLSLSGLVVGWASARPTRRPDASAVPIAPADAS